MKTLDEIQAEVGRWSRENFGRQESKVEPGLALGPLAPLLGIGEELGEWAEAWEEGRTPEIRDSLGDVVIFLCDYACREGFSVAAELARWPAPDRGDPLRGAIAALGRLHHATLKRHQGIREYADPDRAGLYAEARGMAVARLMGHLHRFCRMYFGLQADLGAIINEVWDDAVRRRNWKADAAQGAATAYAAKEASSA